MKFISLIFAPVIMTIKSVTNTFYQYIIKNVNLIMCRPLSRISQKIKSSLAKAENTVQQQNARQLFKIETLKTFSFRVCINHHSTKSEKAHNINHWQSNLKPLEIESFLLFASSLIGCDRKYISLLLYFKF